jgi:hypothetical protein
VCRILYRTETSFECKASYTQTQLSTLMAQLSQMTTGLNVAVAQLPPHQAVADIVAQISHLATARGFHNCSGLRIYLLPTPMPPKRTLPFIFPNKNIVHMSSPRNVSLSHLSNPPRFYHRANIWWWSHGCAVYAAYGLGLFKNWFRGFESLSQHSCMFSFVCVVLSLCLSDLPSSKESCQISKDS